MGSAAVLGLLLAVAGIVAAVVLAFKSRGGRSRMFRQVKRILAEDEHVRAQAILDGLVQSGRQPESQEELAAASTVFRTLSVVGQKVRIGLVGVADIERQWAAPITQYWEHLAPWVQMKRATNMAYYEHYEWLYGQLEKRRNQRNSRRRPSILHRKSASANLS
jgi:hypothetical protein